MKRNIEIIANEIDWTEFDTLQFKPVYDSKTLLHSNKIKSIQHLALSNHTIKTN